MCFLNYWKECRCFLFGEVVVPGKLKCVEVQVHHNACLQVVLVIIQIEHISQYSTTCPQYKYICQYYTICSQYKYISQYVYTLYNRCPQYKHINQNSTRCPQCKHAHQPMHNWIKKVYTCRNKLNFLFTSQWSTNPPDVMNSKILISIVTFEHNLSLINI